MKKQFAFAWLSYTVITFALGFLWHLVIFKDLYDELAIYTRLDNPIFELGILSMLVQGAILSYIYPKFYTGGNPALAGLKFGLVAAVFVASLSVVAEAAKHEVTSLVAWLLIGHAFAFIHLGVTGTVIGLIYGTKPTEQN